MVSNKRRLKLIDLEKIQNEIGEWSVRNFGETGADEKIFGMVEEIGELCHSFLKRKQGIRGTAEEHTENIKDALGDFCVYAMDYCSKEGISFEECIQTTWDKVIQRDWVKNKQTGKVEDGTEV
jgi:NTP pyrophosphatase (non-canonical NTP hydrolase)